MKARRIRVPREVAERIGPYYVYVLVDPRSGQIFYVGKGRGDRLSSHGLAADLAPNARDPEKIRRIRAIERSGRRVRIDVVRYGLEETVALEVEAALIDVLGGLTNRIRGHGSTRGRAPLAELVAQFGASPLTVRAPPVLLIRLGRWTPKKETIEPGHVRAGYGWRLGIPPGELYDASRAWWRVDPQGMQARGVSHFVAVAEGVTRAVYEVTGSIGPRTTDGQRRWAYQGRRLTGGSIFDNYVGPLGRRPPLPKGSRGPIYWPRPN